MHLYLELAQKAAQRQLAYRQANLAGLLTNLFFGALRAYVLIALYGARSQIAGYTMAAAVTSAREPGIESTVRRIYEQRLLDT